MTHLDSVLKSKDIPLPTKVHIVKAMVFPVVMYRCHSWTIKKAEHQGIDAFKLWCWGRRLRESPRQQGDQTSQSKGKSMLNTYWKDWCWSSTTLVTWCKKPTRWKRPWCWERLRAEKGGDREWDGWMASPIQWTWNWANSKRWQGTRKPSVLQSMGSQRVGHGLPNEQQKPTLLHFFYWPFHSFYLSCQICSHKLTISSFQTPRLQIASHWEVSPRLIFHRAYCH